MTAALLSGLVFPGSGQLYLKRIARGLAFIVPTAISASILFRSLFDRALDVLTRVESGSVPLNADALLAAVAQQGDPGMLPTMAGWLMLACWIGSIADAWLLGSKEAAA
jgi:hypothetical protein